MLLDVRLPPHDGFAICRALKHDPLTRLIPVVLMTSSNEERDVLESYRLGVDAYVMKPVHAHALRAAASQLGFAPGG